MVHSIQDPIVRRSARLLAAVLELHKQGYQDLAIHSGMSASGLHWRCSILPFSRIFYEGGAIKIHIQRDDEIAHHTSGESGFHYFGWHDAKNDNAREIAKKIKLRFPELLSLCKRENEAMSGWLTYAVGHAERGNLPVMFADNYGAQPKTIGATGNQSIRRPPYRQLHTDGNVRYLLIDAPHLREEDDWHEAYVSKVQAWRAAPIREYPIYPASTGDIYEIGAYWEGAIYYIQEVLGFKQLDTFLDALEKPNPDSEQWATFLRVWNDQGQLVYLKAFLIRKLLSDQREDDRNQARRDALERWLKQFEAIYSPFAAHFHNPYFGGGNPLHLGLILHGRNGEQPLFYC